MTQHTTAQPRCITTSRTPAPRPRSESPHPRPPASLTPALPPAFEAFCTLHRDRYLDYARAHLPEMDAHRVVRCALGELAVRWPHIVSHPNPVARAWTLLSAYIRTQHPVPPPLSDCPPLQYDALVLNCLLDYSSTAAAEVMGQDPSKIRYLVCSAPSQSRTAARRLRPSR
ncbi:hypothetical protein ACIRRI_44340 [Streptomyces mirabilis]|uniref:hypothetical protein n=1 Tax=Streptomyces mirabilis TaxID=68239 RepID=UPI00381A30A1